MIVVGALTNLSKMAWFRPFDSGVQSLFNDLVERTGDEYQLYIQINAQEHGAGECIHKKRPLCARSINKMSTKTHLVGPGCG